MIFRSNTHRAPIFNSMASHMDEAFRWDGTSDSGEPGKGDPAKDADKGQDLADIKAQLEAERQARADSQKALEELRATVESLKKQPEKPKDKSEDPVLAELKALRSKIEENEAVIKAERARATKERVRQAIVDRAKAKGLELNSLSILGDDEGCVLRPADAGIKVDDTGKIVGDIDRALEGWKKDHAWAFRSPEPKDGEANPEHAERNPGTGKFFHAPGSDKGKELRQRAKERTLAGMGLTPDGKPSASNSVPVYLRSGSGGVGTLG